MNPISRLFSKLWQSTLPKEKPESYYQNLIPQVAYQEGVPKHVYQTFPTKNLPKEAKENVEKMKEINPGWTFHLYDDNDIEQFLLKHYGKEILAYYKRIDPSYGAAKADFFRYMLIYVTGGVYLDYKSSITKPLDNFLLPSDGFILSHWDNREGEMHPTFGNFRGLKVNVQHPRGEIMQWVIISSPGHSLLREVILSMLKLIDKYNPFVEGIGFEGTFRLTGPILYTEAIEKALQKDVCNYRWVELIPNWKLVYSIYEKTNNDSQEQEEYNFKHVKHLKTDYRANISPLIHHPYKSIERICQLYMRFKVKVATTLS